MERFLPILNTIQTRLRRILIKNENGMFNWNMPELRDVGEDLMKLALDVSSQLAEVEHRVLYQSLREAGLGIRQRAVEVQRRRLNDEDKEYFRSVHEALGNLCEKMETGEYYKALLAVASKRLKNKRNNIV